MEILRCIQIGLLCVQEFAIERPNISTILSIPCEVVKSLIFPSQSSLRVLRGRFCPRDILRNLYE
ncbi:hypothetical protein RHGRI_036303 [Rhododendron griersonianum]|nr:hypothetical protein RHGRI_036303 [Rhododendron griersonianum]